MLREATFIDRGVQKKVTYLVTGSEIVFSALGGGWSTINSAEDIVEAICQAECTDVSVVTFYDLQTRTGYPMHKDPGFYSFDRLHFNEHGLVGSWEMIAGCEYGVVDVSLPGLPDHVRNAFGHLII